MLQQSTKGGPSEVLLPAVPESDGMPSRATSPTPVGELLDLASGTSDGPIDREASTVSDGEAQAA